MLFVRLPNRLLLTLATVWGIVGCCICLCVPNIMNFQCHYHVHCALCTNESFNEIHFVELLLLLLQQLSLLYYSYTVLPFGNCDSREWACKCMSMRYSQRVKLLAEDQRDTSSSTETCLPSLLAHTLIVADSFWFLCKRCVPLLLSGKQ